MKQEDVKSGLIVKITKLNKAPHGPLIEQCHIDARKEGETGVAIKGTFQYGSEENAWLIRHDRDGCLAAYAIEEFEPFHERERIQLEAFIDVSGPVRNECIICGRSQSVAIVSFWLSYHLGTHILVPFCTDHLNDVDILNGVGKALLSQADNIECGPTWKEILERNKRQNPKT
jgi:hypothetical protein